MPRFARIKSSSQIYHIMLRGNNREKIFKDEEDKSRIIDTIAEKKEAEEYYLYAYCVMDNHIHLIIKEGTDPVARTVKRITSSYSYYFNKKYKRIGHVFQERYKSENIEDEVYLMSAIRYIHRNPVKAGIGTVEGYKWSSYRDYIDEGRKITDIDRILSIVADSKEKALAEFAKFNHESTEETFIDIGEEKDIDQSNVTEYINNYLTEKGLEIKNLRDAVNKTVRDELVRLLCEKSNLSRREIATVLGLNREMVKKIPMSRDLSQCCQVNIM